MLAPEGYGLILAAAALALATASLGIVFGGWVWLVAALGVAAFGGTVWAFRDPDRAPPADTADLLLAPADGHVVELVTEAEPVYLQGPSQRVAISLSPFSVRVHRSPADGVVEYERHVPGDGPAAGGRTASGTAARTEVGIRHPSGAPVLIRQIAGRLARRIAYDAPLGTHVRAGERYGRTTCWSRMDIAVPPHVALDVQLGQRTVAGETILGTFGAVPLVSARAPVLVEAA